MYNISDVKVDVVLALELVYELVAELRHKLRVFWFILDGRHAEMPRGTVV